MARQKSTSKKIADLKIKPGDRKPKAIEGERGIYVRGDEGGRLSFWIVPRGPAGKQRWSRIPFDGDPATISDDDMVAVRALAREGIARIKAGADKAFPPPPAPEVDETVEAVGKEWVKRYVRAEKLVSGDKIEARLNRLVYPVLGKRPINEIRRRDVAGLLDKIVDENGQWMAQRVYEDVRAMFGWQEGRDEDFVSPVHKQLVPIKKPSARRRKRVLSDQEIHLLWPICAEAGTNGALVQTLLLTAQRLEKVQTMRWEDIDRAGVWTIPARDSREKANAQILPLPKMVIDIIEAQPRMVGNPYVFASARTDHYVNGLSKAKADIDEKLLAALKADAVESGDDPDKVELEPWTRHACRHTAKTIMARIGVDDFDSERVLGHVVPGIGGTYNHHDFKEAIGAALERLAAEVGRIIDPPAGDNVVALRTAAE